MKNNEINSVAIYPPIGISRIGNSNEYFLSSDLPGIPSKPHEGFKDSLGRVKKQVARFRVYAFNKEGEVLQEITTTTDTSIEWRVHVANIKSAWYQFNNVLDLVGSAIPSVLRNESEKNREELIIDPGTRTITGKNKQGEEYQFDSGTFYGKNVPLGEIRTDEDGRLLFFGGNGDAASKDNKPAITFANNEGWHDDTCDGTIRAKVIINGQEFEAKPAMVAVTPPDFGPGLYGVVTMNDVVQDLFIREMDYPNPSNKGIEFWTDIYPLLERMTNTQWVNQGFSMLFGKNSPSDFTNSDILKKLSDPSSVYKTDRTRVFDWFRDPDSKEYTPTKVPPFYGDGFGEYIKIALVDLPITRTQYSRLKEWADGNFVTGERSIQKPFDQLGLAEKINALNQAPLEECLGGPFHPGIELTWPMRVKLMWESPYRLHIMEEGKLPKLDFGPLLSTVIALGKEGPLSSSGPGSLTRWLGVPWQTDEASCLSGYDTSTYLPLPSFWAARVPNQVLSEDSFDRMGVHSLNIAQRLKHFDYRQDWLRDFGSDYTKKINLMVKEWHELGIIAPAEQNNENEFLPDKIWKETGRHFSGEDPTFKQVLYAENEEDHTLEYKDIQKLSLLKSDAPSRERERRTFGRGER